MLSYGVGLLDIGSPDRGRHPVNMASHTVSLSHTRVLLDDSKTLFHTHGARSVFPHCMVVRVGVARPHDDR